MTLIPPINFRFHCARQYPKLASHIFKDSRCAKIGGFLHQPQPFEPSRVKILCPQQLQGKPVPVRQGSIPRHMETHLFPTSREST